MFSYYVSIKNNTYVTYTYIYTYKFFTFLAIAERQMAFGPPVFNKSWRVTTQQVVKVKEYDIPPKLPSPHHFSPPRYVPIYAQQKETPFKPSKVNRQPESEKPKVSW
jgi:hypothetical protein